MAKSINIKRIFFFWYDSVQRIINAAIVGNITIRDDVLIAPNSYVNCDVYSHSIVFGNTCIIKHRENATEGYINRKFKKTLYALIGCLISMINAEYMIHSSKRFLIKLCINGGVIMGALFTLNSCLAVGIGACGGSQANQRRV